MSKIEYSTKEYEVFEVVGPHMLIERFEQEEHKVGNIIIPDSKKYAFGICKVKICFFIFSFIFSPFNRDNPTLVGTR